MIEWNRFGNCLFAPLVLTYLSASLAPSPESVTSGAVPTPVGRDWMWQVDAFFGTWVVAPLQQVLFFDFWSKRWIPAGIPETVKCPNRACGHVHVVASLYPGTELPILIPCPDCHAEIETGAKVPIVVLWLFKSPLSRLLLGSVAERALRLARCPVLVPKR